MSESKTTASAAGVEACLATVTDGARSADCRTLLALMSDITGEPPKLWGRSMIGFGSYHYRYESGREGDWFLTGFSPRKNDLALYIMSGFDGHAALLQRLGKHKTGKSCLYVKRLADIDTTVLEQLVRASVAHMQQTYG